MRKSTLALVVLSGGLWAGTAQAALFRCGNVFQDRPCDAGVTEQQLRPGAGVGKSSGASAATKASPFAATCSRVGEHAQRIAWKREGGATLERQMSEIPGGSDRQEMIAIAEAVYSRRGSATEIRAAIEAECVQRKTEAAQAGDMLRTLQKQAGQGVVEGAPGANTAPAPAATGTTLRVSGQPPAPTAAAPAGPTANPMCGNLREQRTAIESRLRSGGRVETMEMLQRQRREVEKSLAEAGC
jgi:hypothetical protein